MHSDSLFRCHQWHFIKQMIYTDILHNHNFPRTGNCDPSSILFKMQLQKRQKLRKNILHYHLPPIDHQFYANCFCLECTENVYFNDVYFGCSLISCVVAGVDGTVVMWVGILSVCCALRLQISLYSLLDESRHWTDSTNQAAWQLQPWVCITNTGFKNIVNVNSCGECTSKEKALM